MWRHGSHLERRVAVSCRDPRRQGRCRALGHRPAGRRGGLPDDSDAAQRWITSRNAPIRPNLLADPPRVARLELVRHQLQHGRGAMLEAAAVRRLGVGLLVIIRGRALSAMRFRFPNASLAVVLGKRLPAKSSILWSGRRDSNTRPSAPKADALPGCATPRCLDI